MSHYSKMRTRFCNAETLLTALRDVGFKNVEIYEQPVSLVGYEGRERPEQAHIVIRKKYVGSASNDIGFMRNHDGTYVAVISDFDRRTKYGEQWLSRLKQAYGVVEVQSFAKENNFEVEQKSANNEIRLVLRR